MCITTRITFRRRGGGRAGVRWGPRELDVASFRNRTYEKSSDTLNHRFVRAGFDGLGGKQFHTGVAT